MEYFPTDKVAYPQQISMVETMSKAVDAGEHALIEAPTGAGKSFSLLAVAARAAATAIVIVCTRTHTQLDQLIKVFKGMPCRTVATAVLSSRDRTCCNPELDKLSGTAKNEACVTLVNEKNCMYHTTVMTLNGVEDIEDMMARAEAEVGCAYYAQRKFAQQILDAGKGIIFAPYNYILDPAIRASLDIDFTKRVILLVDEAHNAENVLVEALSCECDRAKLKRAAEWFGGNRTPELKDLFEAMHKIQSTEPLAELDDETCPFRLDQISEWQRGLARVCKTGGPFVDLATKFVATLVAFKQHMAGFAIYVEKNVLRFQCLSPSFALADLSAQLRSLVLVSGTLEPFDAVASELGMVFKHRLTVGPVIDVKTQAMIRAVGQWGPYAMDSSFNNARNPVYHAAVGNAVLELAESVPNGMLVFFKSYDMLKTMQEAWVKSGQWAQIEAVKQIFIESDKLDLMAFRSAAASAGGAIMLAVYRGKLSEGVDFADAQARAVICVGIPFAPVKAPSVGEKRKYNDRTPGNIKGEVWYLREAQRAVRQALGRVIRHSKDYGAIILLDAAFIKNPNMISTWARGVLKVTANHGLLCSDLVRFFDGHSLKA